MSLLDRLAVAAGGQSLAVHHDAFTAYEPSGRVARLQHGQSRKLHIVACILFYLQLRRPGDCSKNSSSASCSKQTNACGAPTLATETAAAQ